MADYFYWRVLRVKVFLEVFCCETNEVGKTCSITSKYYVVSTTVQSHWITLQTICFILSQFEES